MAKEGYGFDSAEIVGLRFASSALFGPRLPLPASVTTVAGTRRLITSHWKRRRNCLFLRLSACGGALQFGRYEST